MLRAAHAIEQPVGLVRALTTFGLDLSEAHDIVDRLAAGADVPVTLHLRPQGDSPYVLRRFGLDLAHPSGTGIAPVATATIPSDVLQAIETWRLSQPERPARHEALGLILRHWLAAQGRSSASDRTEVVTLNHAE